MKAMNSIGNKCSIRGVVGKVIGYPEESFPGTTNSGGVVNFCTPGGTIIKTGCIWLKPLTKEEEKLLKNYEADALAKNGWMYDGEVAFIQKSKSDFIKAIIKDLQKQKKSAITRCQKLKTMKGVTDAVSLSYDKAIDFLNSELLVYGNQSCGDCSGTGLYFGTDCQKCNGTGEK